MSNVINVSVDIDVEDVISRLFIDENVNYDIMFDIVKIVDTTISDWEFTEMCYDHFKQLHNDYLDECKS